MSINFRPSPGNTSSRTSAMPGIAQLILACYAAIAAAAQKVHWSGGRGDMRSIICSALMALAITTASAQQSLFSANSVLPGCKAVFEEGRGLGRQDTGYCVGAINALTFLAPTECIEIPDGVTFLQVLLVVIGFVEARPERMDEAFVGLAFEALLEAWPCRPQQPRP